MKKVLLIGLILLLTLLLLTACGGNNGNSSGGSANSNNNSSAPADTSTPNKPAKIVDVPDKILDLHDDSIWFVVIDGVKYDLLSGITVQDFLNAGFALSKDEDENREVEAHEPGGGGSNGYGEVYMHKDDKRYFHMLPFNDSDKILPLKNCGIGWLVIEGGSDISIVCNLSVGCTGDDVKSVFGEGFTEGVKERINAYSYSIQLKSMNQRMFIFRANNSDEITSIQIQAME
jgi:hypothetical protein